MESNSSKRLCLKATQGQNSSDKRNNMVDNRHPLMLPEILQNVFEYVEIKDLKACRLVNKVWNLESCRSLQKTSFVYLRNGNKNQVQRFLRVLGLIRLNGTPTPFDKIHVSIHELDAEFVNLILNSEEDLPLVHVRLTPSKSCENCLAENIYRLLHKNSSSLKYFDCTLSVPVAISWDQVNRERRPPLHLPFLKGLNFDDTDVPIHQSKWTDFLVEVIKAAPNLSTLNMITFDDEVFSSIMNQVDLSSIEEIFVQDFTPRHFPQFSRLHLPKLRSLNLDVVHIAEENMLSSEDLITIVKNFAGSIEELSVNWAASTPIETNFPHCPMLRQLTIDNWPGSLGLFNREKLPVLETITVYEEIDCNVDISLVTDPHDGVVNLKWEGNPRFENMHSYIDEKRVYTIVYISLQFPNLRYLDLTCAASDEMIRTIVTHLPRLEVLELTTECTLSESIFTGINKYTLQHYLDTGISLDTCIRSSSLTDMLSLKKLALHSYDEKGFALTNNAIIYGIAELPSLEFLHIDWNSDLDTEVIVQNLTHLSCIVIKNYQEFLCADTLRALMKAVPQIKFEPNFTTR